METFPTVDGPRGLTQNRHTKIFLRTLLFLHVRNNKEKFKINNKEKLYKGFRFFVKIKHK